ncbi:MAG: HlyD family efflux transporter periplasmic adaptor subunit [Balneolaceae bacterium]
MNKKILISGAAVFALLLVWAIMGGDDSDDLDVFVEPETGEFDVSVSVSGELRAINSTPVLGPEGVREARIWNLVIEDMIPEGTYVREGDYVAQLELNDIHARIQDLELNLQTEEAQYEQVKLDTSLTLTQARNGLENLAFQLEEAEIAVEQSAYESPSVQRQAQVDLDRTRRQLEQEELSYQMRQYQAEARLREIESELREERLDLERARALMDEFTIYAPRDGMLVYHRDRRGRRTTIGSEVSTNEPVIAIIPDFSLMESVTWVNEVDIQKVETDQHVDIRLDAVREKKLTGNVISVGNIGEQRPNSDAKVFEVVIRVAENDTTLRPTMTTSNDIRVASVPDAIYLPLETIHLYDGSHFVYKRDGMSLVMQQVVLGPMNDNSVVILEGVEPEDQVLVSMPPDPEEVNRVMLDEEVLEEYEDEIRELEEQMQIEEESQFQEVEEGQFPGGEGERREENRPDDPPAAQQE